MINSGVHVKGLTKGGENDFYGVIQYMYEVEYNSSTSDKKVILFYCYWLNPSRGVTRMDSKYGIVDTLMNIRCVI